MDEIYVGRKDGRIISLFNQVGGDRWMKVGKWR